MRERVSERVEERSVNLHLFNIEYISPANLHINIYLGNLRSLDCFIARGH